MKFTFILLAFIFNFFNPNFIKAEEVIDLTNNQKENTFEGKSFINEESDVKKIHIVQAGDTITSISNLNQIKNPYKLSIFDLKNS